MWEAIRQNRKRSRWLISVMGAMLVLLGFGIGMLADPEVGGPIGAVAALGYWLVLLLIALNGGDTALMMGARAREISKHDAPQLWNIVEEMTIASGLGKMPRIFLIEDDAPNAFAAGPRPDKSVVAVTSGLLKRLNRDELQGVVAHEIGHIRNLDVRFMTIAAVMVASITIIADLFLRSLWFGAGRRRSSKVDPRAQLIILAVTVALAILAPIGARLLYLAVSRKREYLADASAARFTRYPEGLASALEKIALHPPKSKAVNRALAPLYIVNPLQLRASGGWFSTHPPTEMRIKILRGMAGGAAYVDYDRAFRRAQGKPSGVLDQRTLATDEQRVLARQASSTGGTKQEAIDRIREVDALLGRFAHLILIPCVCGVQIRAPQNLERKSIGCPRCGRQHEVPQAAAGDVEPGQGAAAPLRFQRKGQGWEAFKCTCGKAVQLSPAFRGPSIECPKCRRRIEIVSGNPASETTAHSGS